MTTVQDHRTLRTRAFAGLGRTGLAARGVLYLLVGVLALRIAFGERSAQADRGGALQTLAGQPAGALLVWAVGIGLVCMALWRLSEAVLGDELPKRLAAAGRALFYAVVAASVLAFAAGSRSSGSGASDRQSRDLTARVLGLPAGRWLVGLAALALLVTGVVIAVRAVMRAYRDKLKTAEMPPWAERAVDVVGVPGGLTRGSVFAAVGVFAGYAALRYDPTEAKGVDDTLRAFAGTPAGPWLLALAALGLAAFGLFSWAMAGWRRIDT
ncbi:hypothetical protein DEJ50_02555 [Streptomyces venezuelae]|uniref:DUF1206 domain-containing protein n=1 Tax=Streptomyces venezuelae TaxID=54571 RepID=A0A5P2CVG7_STRVZ|nr:DUF1206 domain-containing protein [Streptomyces venezuelae]QES46896.1 hypothetical protein DEJ50_02555 [Streptomyces venezuelae]